MLRLFRYGLPFGKKKIQAHVYSEALASPLARLKLPRLSLKKRLTATKDSPESVLQYMTLSAGSLFRHNAEYDILRVLAAMGANDLCGLSRS